MDLERTPAEADDERPATGRSAPSPRPDDAETAAADSVAAGRVARTLPLADPATPTEGRTPIDPRAAVEPRLAADPRPSSANETTVPTNIYRARRPAVAAFLIIPALLVALLLVRALTVSAFGETFLIAGVIASCLAFASLPLLVAGLYGLITGAAHGAEQWGFRVWARPPLAYLVVGLAFVVAAGLAIS